MAKDNKGICKLCLKQSILRNSHILPEFLYSEVYDEKHRGVAISQEKDEFFQKGLREYLLCQNCETKLSKYERYAKEIIKKISKFPQDTTGRYFYSENINYLYFKIFQLPILWRSSIAVGGAFKQIQLGLHEEKIRTMIDKGLPGKTYDYGCFMSIIPDTELLHKILQSPTKFTKKFLGCDAYKFVTGNLTWVFVISDYRFPADLQEIFLQENGLIRVAVSKHDEKTEIIKLAETFQKLTSRK